MIADEREKARAVSTQIKLALVTHDPSTFMPLFFGDTSPVKPSADQPEPLTEDSDLADTTGTWKFTEQVAPEDAEAILAELMATTNGRVTSGDGDWK